MFTALLLIILISCSLLHEFTISRVPYAAAYLTAEKEIQILDQFAAEVEEYCIAPCATAVPVTDRVASVKLATFFYRIATHERNIERLLGQEPNTFRLSEGSTMGAWRKGQTLSQFADDPRVRNICEIGFNAGHSALNFLTSNPNATVIGFDIFRYNYSGAAVQSLKSMFHHRRLVVIAGASGESVPDFAAVVGPSFKCQLIFIDGGHSAEALQQDLMQMQQLADPAHHVVVIDDLNDEALSNVYTDWVQSGRLLEIEMLDNIRSSDYIQWRPSADGAYYEFDFGTEENMAKFHANAKFGIARYTFDDSLQ